MDARFQKFCAALGLRVRAIRHERKMTQEDMMDHGFAVRHYQRIEAGRSMTLHTIWKLSRAFGVPPRTILPAGFIPRGGRQFRTMRRASRR